MFFVTLQELNKHIEDGLGKNLAERCSSEVNQSMHQSQQEMIGRRRNVNTSHLEDNLRKFSFKRIFLLIMLNIDSIKDKAKAMIYQDCLAQSCVSDTNQ